jgi:hypothetical protein
MSVLRWIFCILLCVNAAFAQTNIEAVRKNLGNKPGASGIVNASLVASDGNKKEVTYGASTLAGVRVDLNLLFTNAWVRIGYRNGEMHENMLFGHLRHNWQFNDWLFSDVFVQAEKDSYRKLDLRAIVGSGPRFIFNISDALSITYGTSYMYEINRANQSAYVFHRWNNYTTTMLRLDGFSTDNTTYYQPAFDNFYNYRFLNTTSIGVGSGTVGAKITFQYQYESKPPAKQIKQEDIKLFSTLQIKF